MITPRVQLFIALALATATGRAQALALGDLHGASHRGEPLRAYVDLYPDSGETPTRLELLPDLFDPASRAQAALLAGIEARVVRDRTGATGIELRSVAPLLTHQISFRLRAETGATASVKRYRLTLATPAAAGADAAASRPARPRARPGLDSARPADVVTERYGPVKDGESLWTIARRLSGAANPQALMQALHAANPHAFVGGDIDRLRAGVWLSVPQPAAGTMPVPATPPAPRPEAVRAPVAEARPAATPGPRAEAPAIGRDPALTAQLAALDAKFAAIRARYADPGAAPTSAVTLPAVPGAAASLPAVSDGAAGRLFAEAAEAAPAAAIPAAAIPAAAVPAEAVPGGSPAGGSGASASPPGEAPVTAVDAAVPVTGVEPSATAVAAAPGTGSAASAAEQTASWASPLRLGFAAGALLLAGLIAALARRRIARRRLQTARSEHVTREARRRAEVARKAENRVRLESEVRDLLVHKPDGDGEAAAAGSAATRDDEIAAHIAHGRYAQAARQLRELLAEAPQDHAAKLRLAEVYYITEQVQEFGDVAADIKANHRSDVSNDEWQRLMRMGKIIAPDLPLFSGPQAVARRA